jgi:hypothetical protein
MTKVTDRLDSQNLINLARQQYEQKQRTRIPPVVVKLPSGGAVYPKSSPLSAGTVEMRHMTAYEEDILTNSTYIANNLVFDKLLESLVVTPGVDVSDIIPADRDGLIVSARIFGYGKKYPVSVTDPKTKTELTRTVDLSTLTFRPFTLTPDDNGEFDYEITETKNKIKFKYISARESKQIDPDRSVSQLMELCIMEVDGNRDKNFISDFIKYEFVAGPGREFREYLVNNLPGFDYNVEFEGEDGSTFTAGFQLGPDLFWF